MRTILFVSILASAKLYGQNPRKILEELQHSLQNKNLFQYECQYRIKYFDNTDTTAFSNYNVIISKNPNDTILNYNARVYNTQDERIYDGRDFYLIWHRDKRILKDMPHVTGKRFVLNNIQRQHIPALLYSKTVFKSYTESKEVFLSEVRFEGIDCWKLEIHLPTDDEITFLSRIFYLERDSLKIIRIEGIAKYQNIQDEYWELRIKNFRAAKLAEVDFTNYYKYPEGYTEETYEVPQIDLTLLTDGTHVPPITGRDITNDSTQINFENKLILLDFWYLSCAPCLRAIPKLSSISENFKGRLTVYGINPFDDPISKADILKQFSKHLNINYPLIFTNNAVIQTYRVKSYPTLYLIKDGIIIYSHIGFTENSFIMLEKAIQKQLIKSN